MDRRHDYLVISGGCSDGAYGAGLLVGWTETGTRFEFQIVTGISTGALIAPFAFLGPDYDPSLRKVYTQFSTDELVEPRGPGARSSGRGMADARPAQLRPMFGATQRSADQSTGDPASIPAFQAAPDDQTSN